MTLLLIVWDKCYIFTYTITYSVCYAVTEKVRPSCASHLVSLSGSDPPSSTFSPSLWCGSRLHDASPLPLCSFKHFPSPHCWALLFLCFSFLFWLPTCLTLCCFFFRHSTALAATQYFQFTLLLSNLPLHSSHTPFIIGPYLPLPSVLLLLLACLKDAFKDLLSPTAQ